MGNLVIAHISDLHLSQFGERVTATALLRGELPRAGLISQVKWEEFEQINGWRIQRWSALRRSAIRSVSLRLLDPNGVRHDRHLIAPGRGHTRKVDEALGKMRTLIRIRSQTSLSALCEQPLPTEQRQELLELDSKNTNLRFLEAVEEIQKLGPDVVVLTGDITDDGKGYELVLCALREYIDAHRLFAVAGNHDLSAVPPGTSHNMKLSDKASRWSAFHSAIGLKAEHQGASALEVNGAFFLGLNSSVRPSRVAFSGRGRVGKNQLAVAAHLIEQSAGAKIKICCLHHHVAHLRLGPIARADPGQFAMKLADAKDVIELLGAHQFDVVLNGHRHHGYHVHEANLPHVVSSPSTTLGCRASGARYFWRIRVGDSGLRVDRHYFG